MNIKATLKKSLFSVQQVAEIIATRAAANSSSFFLFSFFFFFFSFFFGEKSTENWWGKNEKKVPVCSTGRYTRNNNFFKGGLSPKAKWTLATGSLRSLY